MFLRASWNRTLGGLDRLSDGYKKLKKASPSCFASSQSKTKPVSEVIFAPRKFITVRLAGDPCGMSLLQK